MNEIRAAAKEIFQLERSETRRRCEILSRRSRTLRDIVQRKIAVYEISPKFGRARGLENATIATTHTSSGVNHSQIPIISAF